MSAKTLKDLFIDELQDMYDAEHRIVLALPKMVHAATCPDLKSALEHHWEETKGHITRIEQVFTSIGKTAKAKKCEATVGLLKEADEIISDFKGSPAINAALVAAGQKVEHYEIASYGCLHEWAGLLDHSEAADLLEQTLTEEKAANDKMTELARASGNKQACENNGGKADQAPVQQTPAPSNAGKTKPTPARANASESKAKAPEVKVKAAPAKPAAPPVKITGKADKAKALPFKNNAVPGKAKELSGKAKGLKDKARNK